MGQELFITSHTGEQWYPVKSSNVEAISYDALAKILKVRFLARKREPRRTWAYSDVPIDVFTDMLVSASKGRFVWRRLRDGFVGTEVTASET